MKLSKKIIRASITSYDLASYVVAKFIKDSCFEAASALAYTTLLSIVPLMAVSVFVIKGMPFFQGFWDETQQYIFNHFVPATGSEVQKYLEEFLNNVSKVTVVGGVSLIFSAMLLIYTIENTFNRIWHVKSSRGFLNSFFLYWSLLTVTPILIGIGSYIWSLSIIPHNLNLWLNYNWVTLLPFILTWICLAILYILIPNCKVSFFCAALGAIIATILFEISKKLFVIYVSGLTLNAIIYGTFATIPFFLVWIYISWLIILLGAEIASSLPLFISAKK